MCVFYECFLVLCCLSPSLLSSCAPQQPGFSLHTCSVWFISPALSPEFFLLHHTCTSPPSLGLFVLTSVLFPRSLFLHLFSSHPCVTPVILRSFVLSFASFLLPISLLIIFWILWINEQLSLKLLRVESSGLSSAFRSCFCLRDSLRKLSRSTVK